MTISPARNYHPLHYVCGVSFPRSGHHLLVRILRGYFGEGFVYCEFYKKDKDCCRESPCVRTNATHFSKNHDYDASVVVKPGHTYLVQYRKFQDSLVSDFELHVRHIGIDTADEFREFAEWKLASYKLFMHRWATVEVSNTQTALLSYEHLTSDPMGVMQKILPLFAPGNPIDQNHLASVIANTSQVTVNEGRKIEATQKGVMASRDVQAFRYYDAVLFEKLEKESQDAYERMNRLPFLRQNEDVSETCNQVKHWQPPASLNIDITGMLDIADQQPTGIPRIQNFLLEMALSDPDPMVRVVIFDFERRRYRYARAELKWLNLIQARSLSSKLKSTLLRRIRLTFEVAKDTPSSKSSDRILASQIVDRHKHRLLHSFFKRVIRVVRWRYKAANAHATVVPLDLSNAVLLHSHMVVFGKSFPHTLEVDTRRAFICHDMIPWSRPDYAFDGDQAQRFVTHLKILAETGVHALITSDTSSQALASFAASIGSASIRCDRFPMPAMLYDLATRQPDMIRPIKIEEPFILYCSTIEVRKNHLLLARIWVRALREGITLPKLICAGKRGWNIEALDTFMADHLEIRSHIEFRGAVSDAELIGLYRGALFGVMPSFEEGWGLPASECLDFGTPIIVSNIPALIEASQGLMPAVDPLDEDGWFEIIKQLAADPATLASLRDTIQQRYRRVMPQESWNVIKSRLLLTTHK